MTTVPASLERFYSELAPLLFGRIDVAELERRLGSSPSGPVNLDFYRVLLGRNVDRILRELFPSVHALVERERPGTWPGLVRAYADSVGDEGMRGAGTTVRDPNRFGLEFADFLASRRAADPGQPEVLEELADWHMCRYLAAVAPEPAVGEPEPDGFEVRVFVRGYTHPIPRFARALAQTPASPIPDPRATTVVIYRSLLGERSLRAHRPTAAELAALAHREGITPTGPLAEIGPAALAEGLARLVARGIVGERGAGLGRG